jgi:hypothetical protein
MNANERESEVGPPSEVAAPVASAVHPLYYSERLTALALNAVRMRQRFIEDAVVFKEHPLRFFMSEDSLEKVSEQLGGVAKDIERVDEEMRKEFAALQVKAKTAEAKE